MQRRLRFTKTGTQSVEKFLKYLWSVSRKGMGTIPTTLLTLEPTYIFGKNEEVDEHNNKMLEGAMA